MNGPLNGKADGSLTLNGSDNCPQLVDQSTGHLSVDVSRAQSKPRITSDLFGAWGGTVSYLDQGDHSTKQMDCRIDLAQNDKYLFIYTYNHEENCYFNPANSPLFEIRGDQLYSDSIGAADGGVVSGVVGSLGQDNLSLNYSDPFAAFKWDLAWYSDGSLRSSASNTCVDTKMCVEDDIVGTLESTDGTRP